MNKPGCPVSETEICIEGGILRVRKPVLKALDGYDIPDEIPCQVQEVRAIVQYPFRVEAAERLDLADAFFLNYVSAEVLDSGRVPTEIIHCKCDVPGLCEIKDFPGIPKGKCKRFLSINCPDAPVLHDLAYDGFMS